MLISLLSINPLVFLIVAVSLILAIGIHEFAHAWVADYLGDPTPRLQGRITLNPLAHLDPIGTLFILILGFGWGKAVVYDPYNLRHPVRDAALISLAGPASNILLALMCALLIRIIFSSTMATGLSAFAITILTLMIQFNILLAVFNLLPFSPLDGFKVVAGILPKSLYRDWMALSPFGMIFLFLLIFPIFGGASAFQTFVYPVVDTIVSFLIPQGSMI